jgi:hypothetical protein
MAHQTHALARQTPPKRVATLPAIPEVAYFLCWRRVGRANNPKTHDEFSGRNSAYPLPLSELNMTTCPFCHSKCRIREDLAGRRVKCPACGESFFAPDELEESLEDAAGTQFSESEVPSTNQHARLSTAQIVGLAGCVLLVIGVFVPLISVPLAGNINYIHSGHGDGIVVLILVAISGILIMGRRARGLWFTGLGVLALMAFTFTNIQVGMSEARAVLRRDLAGNPFAGAGDAMLQSVQLEWGWAILLIGAALLVTSAIITEVAKWPEHRVQILVAGAASIPITLVCVGLATWFLPAMLKEMRENSERIEANRIQAEKREQEQRALQEAKDLEEAREKERQEAAAERMALSRKAECFTLPSCPIRHHDQTRSPFDRAVCLRVLHHC